MVLSPKIINSVRVGFFMPPEIWRDIWMDFLKSVRFSMVVFFMVGFLYKSWKVFTTTAKHSKLYAKETELRDSLQRNKVQYLAS